LKLSNYFTLTFAIISLILLWSLKEIIIQIFGGIIIALSLCSLTGKVQSSLSIPRIIALALSLITILIFSIITFLIVVPQFTNEFQQLIIQLPSSANAVWDFCNEKVNEFLLITFGDNASNLVEDGLLENLNITFPDGASIANGVTESISKILGLASNLGVGIIQIIFIFSVSLMITVQPHSYREVFILLIPSFYRKRSREILLYCGDALTSWMFGVLISSTFVALIAGICLYFLGVKLVIANALLAGILNIIPNVGPTISTIFPMSVAFLDAPWKALAVLGIYIIIQNLESYLITPSIMHKQVKLLPGLALTAQFIFTIIFGPIGLLLALPLAVVIQVLVKEILIKDILDNKEKYQIEA
tara:strand:- start:8430 stop:9509 length:1080 start_codon:yes stop_codon:yes gene_type:complete